MASLESFFLEMTRHPDIQEKAQREIDGFVGSARLPSFDDEDSLPYVKALFKEVLRFHPVAPCGKAYHIFPLHDLNCTVNVSHAAGLRELTADDVYKGYRMPAGSVVLVNAWFVPLLYNSFTSGTIIESD